MSLTKPDKKQVEPIADPFRDAGKRCGVGHTKWYELLKAGELRTYTVGKRRFMSRSAQAEFIARREAETASKAA